jgi:hypothetical protein
VTKFSCIIQCTFFPDIEAEDYAAAVKEAEKIARTLTEEHGLSFIVESVQYDTPLQEDQT